MGACRSALIGDPPDSPRGIVSDVKGAVRPNRKPGRPMHDTIAAGTESISEHGIFSGRFSVGKRLEHDVISFLRPE